MTDPLEITSSCGCAYCDLEVEHSAEPCGILRALRRLNVDPDAPIEGETVLGSFDDWLVEEGIADDANQIAADHLRRLLLEGRDSGSDGKTADKHIAELRALLEERRRGEFVSLEEGRRRTREMINRKRRERGLGDAD